MAAEPDVPLYDHAPPPWSAMVSVAPEALAPREAVSVGMVKNGVRSRKVEHVLSL